MKKQLLLILAISLFFVGCTMEKRHYNSGYHVEWYSQKGKVKKAEPAAQPEKEAEQPMIAQSENIGNVNETVVDAPMIAEQIATPVASETRASIPAKKMEKQITKAQKKENLRNEMNAERNVSKSVEKGFVAQSSISEMDTANSSMSDVPMILLVILAIILPPLAVYLHSGIGTPFWISLILTLLFWVPGVIYALLVVLDVI